MDQEPVGLVPLDGGGRDRLLRDVHVTLLELQPQLPAVDLDVGQDRVVAEHVPQRMDYFATRRAVVAQDDELVAAPTDERAARIRVAHAASHAAQTLRP